MISEFEEIVNYDFDKPSYRVKEICKKFSVPVKTFKTWQYRGEIGYPIIVKVKGSRFLLVMAKPFAKWFAEKKLGSIPTIAENKVTFQKQIKAMAEARGL